jgi:hypothetical protein
MRNLVTDVGPRRLDHLRLLSAPHTLICILELIMIHPHLTALARYL